MANLETKIQNEVILALGQQCGSICRIFRQQVGFFVAYQNPEARPVQVGVKGMADLSGILLPGGWRLEIEIKTPTGKQSPEQVKWAEMIRAFGGIYIVVRSADEAVSMIKTLSLTGPPGRRIGL